MANYEKIRDKIKTGDIILFSGKGGISHGIKLVTNSKWSHVGMALRLPEWDTVLLWESTTLSNLKDAIDGTAKRGVQIVQLSGRIRTYDGEISIRHLQNVNIDKEDSMKKRLMKFRKEVRNRPYEKDKIELIKAAYDGPLGHNEEDLSSLFCSELIAEAYQRMGLLRESPSGLPSNEYTPKDFSDTRTLKLQKGASLSNEILIAS